MNLEPATNRVIDNVRLHRCFKRHFYEVSLEAITTPYVVTSGSKNRFRFIVENDVLLILSRKLLNGFFNGPGCYWVLSKSLLFPKPLVEVGGKSFDVFVVSGKQHGDMMMTGRILNHPLIDGIYLLSNVRDNRFCDVSRFFAVGNITNAVLHLFHQIPG
ncbi:MAG TPA: hypothetical protein VN844_18910 [Pyrinomonadaceae bacterium]|nr:hypothetical protein [Pyrinomonadaceae bacterium]